MKKTIYSAVILLLFFALCLLNGTKAYAQNIGINGTGANANASALLDIDDAGSNNKGLLIPRISLTAINVASPVTSPATSLLIYNIATAGSGATAVSPGYYYWDGTQWVRFAYSPSGSSANAWTVLGNTGTSSTTNFIGTTDGQDFVVKTNNNESMRVLNNGNIGIGLTNPAQKLEVANNIGIRSSNPFLYFSSTFTAIPADGSIGIRSAGEIVLRSNITNTLLPDWEVKYGIGTNAFPNDFFYVGRRATSTSTLVNYFAINSSGNVGVNTITPATKLSIISGTIGSGFQLQDGSEGAGKTLVSDATGKASWQSPSSLANYPFQSIGPLPMGASCPVGGTYATNSIVLPAGIYYYTNYSCDGQIGASTPAGFNVDVQIVSGTGDSNGTFHDFNIGFGGSCGNYFTGIVRCFTPCTVRRVYTSYGGSSFTVSVANSESTLFIKIL